MLSIDMLKSMAQDPHTKSILETIELSARRGSDIVQQVLSFARGMEGQRIVIQPKYLLKDIEHIVTDTFPKDIRLQTDVAARYLDDSRRSHAGAAGPAQSLRERARCHAQRRHARDQGGELPRRRALRRHEPAGQARFVRGHFGDRHRRGHSAGDHRSNFRAFFHHEGGRQRAPGSACRRSRRS